MKREQLKDYGINAYVATVTKEDADAIVALSSVENRKLRPTRVAYYAEAMTRGEWLVGPPILMSGSDVVDGHHRLAAVPNSGATVKFIVLDLPDASVYQVVDDNVKRTVADVLPTDQHNRNRTAAAAKAMMAGMAGAINSHFATRLTRSQNIDFIQDYREVFEWLNGHLESSVKGLVSAPVAGAFGRAYLHLDTILLERCARTLSTGLVPQDDGHRYAPIILLRNWLLCGKRSGRFRAEAYGKTERALAAVRDGQTLNVLKAPDVEMFPLPVELVPQSCR